MPNIPILKVGYGQVEPNRLTAQKTREIFSQLPADSSIKEIENGMFLTYDETTKTVRMPSADGAKACLVMNEIILSDERTQADSDYVMVAHVATPYQPDMDAYPRLYGMHVGDIFTTNVVKVAIKDTAPAEGDKFTIDPVAGDKFIVEATSGYLMPIGTNAEADCAMIFTVTKPEAVLPDGQMAVQFVCTKVLNHLTPAPQPD